MKGPPGTPEGVHRPREKARPSPVGRVPLTYLNVSAPHPDTYRSEAFDRAHERWQSRGFREVSMGRPLRIMRFRAPLHADLLRLPRGGGPVVLPAAETDFYWPGSVGPFARRRLAWPCSGSIFVG